MKNSREHTSCDEFVRTRARKRERERETSKQSSVSESEGLLAINWSAAFSEPAGFRFGFCAIIRTLTNCSANKLSIKRPDRPLREITAVSSQLLSMAIARFIITWSMERG